MRQRRVHRLIVVRYQEGRRRLARRLGPKELRRLTAAITLLAMAPGAIAGPLLRPAGAPPPGSADAAAAAARAAQAAQTAARQANDSLQRASETVRRFRAQQDAARAAALASSVPNGLTPGGLVIAPGATTTPDLWTGAALPTQSSRAERTDVSIVQTRPKAILTWETFNVGRQTDVHFDQTAGGSDAPDWIVLNRVNDPNARPSQILGSIRAEGQVYLINPNGIIFGGSSQVNVNSLIASSLDFYGRTLEERNRRFLDGILFNPAERTTPALVFGERLENRYDELAPDPEANHNPTETFARGDGVTVEAGARISATGGRAMLLGHNVINAGTIEATDGEVVLAAGRGIYLNKNYPRGVTNRAPDAAVRAISVGVNRGGRVENTGIISSERGAINIQGKSILQAGLLHATTGPTANGYINLTAGDGIDTAFSYPSPRVLGDLTFGEGSTTQILPDLGSPPAVGFDQFRPSSMEIFGRYVTFGRDSTLYAPGAKVKVDAQRGVDVHDWVRDPHTNLLVESPDDARIYLSSGARLDVSGLRGVEVAMSRNTIAAEIRANELRDNPIMRDSFLNGQRVYFDARRGTSLVNVSGFYDFIERAVAELMTEGGTLQLKGPQIITRAGSTIDVSGGSLNYLGGYVKSTRLVDISGNVVPIENADPNVEYVGFAGDHMVQHVRWGVTERYSSPLMREQGSYQAGYVEGRSAGTLTIGQIDSGDLSSGAYGQRILDGDVVADVVVGPNQRAAPAGATARDVTRVWRERPLGATLNFGFPGPATSGSPPSGGDITVGRAQPLPDDFAFDTRLDPSTAYSHVLPSRYFDGRTFSVVNLYSGSVGADGTVPAGRLSIGEGVTVDLGDYGRFNFTGTRADIDGTIRAAGGSVRITASRVAAQPGPDGPSQPDWTTLESARRPQINLGSTAVIDVAGRWVNEFLNAADQAQTSINGGSVTLLTSNDLNLSAGSLIDVSGGGRLAANGRKVTAGSAGSIILINSRPVTGATSAPVGPRDGVMNLAGTLRGYGLGAGGSLSIYTGQSVLISSQEPAPSNAPPGLILSPDFFRQGGFANYLISGSSGVTVAANTVISPEVQSFIFDGSNRSLQTGAHLYGAMQRSVVTDPVARPMSLTLSAPAIDANGDPLLVDGWLQTIEEAPGQVTLSTGAEIRMAPKSTVRLASGTNIFVDGRVSTPGGLIDLRIGYNRRTGTGYLPAIRLGQNAQLLAQGYVLTNRVGLFTRRSIEDAGRVSFGTVLLGPTGVTSDKFSAVMTDAGSLIDVSGVQGLADLAPASTPLSRPSQRYVERLVDGAAGSISFAPESGGVLAGQLRLAPGGETGRGGLLEIGSPQVTVAQAVPVSLPGVTADSAIDRRMLGLTVFADRVNASGTDDLTLKPRGQETTRALIFEGDVSLSTRRSIEIGGPLISVRPGHAGNVNISSEYVLFYPRNSPRDLLGAPPLATSLAGTLTVNADLIDVRSGMDFGCGSAACATAGVNVGFARVSLLSRGDIRLESEGEISSRARISIGGALTLQAAQVYITSNIGASRSTLDPGFLINSNQSVTILGNGAAAPVPFSYGDRLTIRAPEIVQAGVLRAPLGEIRLEGSRSVTLAPGSLTSTSLEDLRLVGSATGVNPDNPFPGLAPSGDLTLLPNKAVRLTSPNVTVSEGSTIDVSGGGDIASWQFIRGNGGSRNILRDRGVFAILPGQGDAPRPAGWQDRRDTDSFYTTTLPRVGDQVYLEGVPGLPAGRYTLLPADYAELPGGLLIRTVGTGLAQRPVTTPRPDGSSVVGGYRLVNGTPIRDAGYSRFLVMPQSAFNKYSTFATYSYNDFIASSAELAGISARAGLDGGSVVLNATSNLILNGTGRFGAAPGGLLGDLDIASPRIAVVGGGATAPAGYLSIDADKITRFGAGSIFIGGTRSQRASGTNLAVTATDVIVNNGAGSALTGPEILLGAQNTVTIMPGSVIIAQGQQMNDTNPLLITGSGALLRVSTGDRVPVTRTNPDPTRGVLNVGAGVTLRSSGAITLDGTNSLSLNPTAVFDAAKLDLSSGQVSIGDVPSSVTGTVLSGATLANLGHARDLLIRGTRSIDLYGNFQLGSRDGSGVATLGTLTLDTALLNGHAASGDTASITAQQIVLRNSGMAGSARESHTGILSLDADKLVLGPGTLFVGGFSTVNARANALLATGSGRFDFAGSMSVATDLLNAAGGSDYAIRAARSLIVARSSSASRTSEEFGGRLSLEGSSLTLDTTVDMPAGILEAHAASGDLMLGSSAVLRLRGRAVDFRDVFKITSGGTLRLSASANILAANGAAIDVSADPRGGDAGWIEVTAGGRVSLPDAIRAAASRGYRGGGLTLDAGSLADFGLLNAALERGTFNRSRSIHVVGGDLALGSGQSLTAHDVLLRSDNGAVSIAGTINAAGDSASADGGSIRLFGGSGVSVTDSAVLDARAGVPRPGAFLADSGSVEIAATGGRLSISRGAVVDVSGGKQGGGKILVAAQRDGNDVAIDGLDGSFRGAREMAIAGVRSYQMSDVDAVQRDGMLEDAAAWMANAPAIQARLGAAFEVRPGISVRSAGDLAISADFDLSSARYGAGAPGYLDFSAAGDININANLSDGFSSASRTAALSTGQSWGYGFEAGRDITLASGKLVRTGTGDIRFRAGRDLVLGDTLSVIYTAGSRTETEAGYEPLVDRVTEEFPTQGGNISLTAGRNISAPLTRESASAWLFRYGDSEWTGDPRTTPVVEQTSWSIVFANFEQGVGALGGGRVNVTAGGDITQLAVSIPTTGHLTTAIGAVAQPGDLHVRGGGDLTLRAGGDIRGGVFMLGQGAAEVTAGGRLTSGPTLVSQRDAVELGSTGVLAYSAKPLAALFGLADATLTVNARTGAEIEAAFDLMMQGQICQNSLCTGSGFNTRVTAGSAFFGMTERTAMNVTSTGGDVRYNANPWASVDLTHGTSREAFMYSRPVAVGDRPSTTASFARAPGTVRLAALQGDVILANKQGQPGSLVLAPTDNGTVELLAKIGLRGGGTLNNPLDIRFAVTMLDVGADYRRGALQAFSVSDDARMDVRITVPGVATNYDRGLIPAHINDSTPARLYSMTKSLTLLQFPPSVTVPKALSIYTGRDLNGTFRSQNNRPDDLSSFVAERDTDSLNITVTGIGDAVVEAGRNLKRTSVISAGNASMPNQNLALPSRAGANIYMYAGTARDTDYDSFTAAYLDTQSSGQVVRTYLPELAVFMRRLGFTGLSDQELVDVFKNLPLASRKLFAQQILFTELKETGLDVTDSTSPRYQSYSRGYAAIHRLFPRDTTQLTDKERSNVLLNASKVETQAGGNITVLAPYGHLEIGGVAAAGAPEDGGLVTRRGGSIRIMADQNIDLFASRVFTLQGGDITMWSSNGDITAGIGAKTTVFRPPLTYVIDNDGRVSLNIFGLQTGAGIGVLDAGGSGTREKSRLDLIAPRGEVNAGDAGIRVVGDLNIAALRVVGVDNIQISGGGTATGVPRVVPPNVVALTEATKVLTASTERLTGAAQTKTTPEQLPSVITVEVIGYEEQTRPTASENEEQQKRRKP